MEVAAAAAAAARMAISVEEEIETELASVNEWDKVTNDGVFNGSGPVVGSAFLTVYHCNCSFVPTNYFATFMNLPF